MSLDRRVIPRGAEADRKGDAVRIGQRAGTLVGRGCG